MTILFQCFIFIKGALKEKFPCLNHLRVQPIFAANLVLSCAILHNVAIDKEEVLANLGEVSEVEEEAEEEINAEENFPTEYTNRTLENLINFF